MNAARARFTRPVLPAALLVAASAFITACGGGGGGGSSAPAVAIATVPPSTAPAGTPTGSFGPIPSFVATPVAITPATGGTNVALTSPNGLSGSLALGAVDPSNGLGTSYTVRFSSTPFAGVPDFAAQASGVKGEIVYLLAQTAPGQGVNYLGTSKLTLTLPAQYQGGNAYWIALNFTSPTFNGTWPTQATAPAGSINPIQGAVNGSTVTFTFANPGLQLIAGAQYSIVFYAT